jgi:translation initiation factor IF-2-like protein
MSWRVEPSIASRLLTTLVNVQLRLREDHTDEFAPRRRRPLGRVRVHELAKELRVESKVVLAALQQMGYYAKSASSEVDSDAARQVRQRIPVIETGPANRSAGASRPPTGNRRSRIARGLSPEACFKDRAVAQAARALGLSEISPRSSGPRRPLKGNRASSP